MKHNISKLSTPSHQDHEEVTRTSYSDSVSVDLDEVLSPPRIDTGSGVVATVGEAGSVGCCCWNGGGSFWGEGWGLRLV